MVQELTAMKRSRSSVSLRHSKLIRKRRELTIKHDWKMLLLLIIIAIIGCLLGAYLGLNYHD
jgi:uncharacterized membrane protein YfcA